MGLVRVRDKNGVVKEMVSLKGEKGGLIDHTHPVEEIFHGEVTVDKLLGDVVDKATVAITTATGASDDVRTLGAQLDEHAELVETVRGQADAADLNAQTALAKVGSLETTTEEMNEQINRLEEETIPEISGKVDTAQQWAEEAQNTANTAQGDAITAQRKADDALDGVEIANAKTSELTAQMGDIETALDGIISIQNALIGGDGV